MSVKKIEVEITIDKQGNITYDVKGMKGKKCVKELTFLDEALGEVTEKKFKPEYYEEEVRTSRQIRTRR